MEGDPTPVSDGLRGRRIIRRDLNGRTTGPTRRSTKGQWTAEEDEMLQRAVKQFEGKHWKKIAQCFEGRTDVQCLHRWQKVLNPALVKGPWTKEEDKDLVRLVKKYGAQKWSTIAQHLPGRIGKQCRERWHNQLNPAINKEPWTQDEEVMLIHAHKVYGNKWAELTKFLPRRTDNAIKNHWNSSLRKKLDAYIKSGLLEKFQGLPSVVIQSTPTTSSRTQQCSEDADDEEDQLADMSEAFVADDKTQPAEDSQNENNPGSDLDEFSKFIEQNYSQDPAGPCTDRGQPSSGEFFDISSLDLSQDSELMQCVDFDVAAQTLTSENDCPDVTPPPDGSSDPLLYQQSYYSENLNPAADIEMAQKEEDISTTVNVQQPHGVLVEHASVENSGIFGETPLKNSLESPSAWNSPWSPFVPGPPIDTNITLADVEGYFTSPGERSYDALGLMNS